jgi:hypothetical protein
MHTDRDRHNGAMINRLRKWIRRMERRWIRDPDERERHGRVVRGRLARPVPPEDGVDEPA